MPHTLADPIADPLQDGLLAHLADAERGPKREGLFALWLTARVACDLAAGTGVAERAWRRRHAALELRLSSLTLAAPLRRALAAALGHLREPLAANGPLVLGQLAAPARDSFGAAPADLLARAAKELRVRLLSSSPTPASPHALAPRPRAARRAPARSTPARTPRRPHRRGG